MIPIAIAERIRDLGDLLSSIRKIIAAKTIGNKNINTHIPYTLIADDSKNILPKD